MLLLDQRGTGSSTPVTAQTLRGVGDADAQAAYLEHFRADSIVKDCEVVRKQLCANKKITLLGQSFGGFCILSYLSFAPKAIERALFTFGLAPITKTADDVYRATFTRMEERCRKYYARYLGDVELVRSIVRKLDAEPAPMPRGGTLTARRFLQLGLLLGSGSGLETLHDLLEHAFVDTADGPVLADGFLLAVEAAQQGFETNPIYWLLHEAIYCEPGSGASAWAAERVQASLGDAWDYKTRLKEGAAPVLLTGEMVYSWMGEDYAWLPVGSSSPSPRSSRRRATGRRSMTRRRCAAAPRRAPRSSRMRTSTSSARSARRRRRCSAAALQVLDHQRVPALGVARPARRRLRAAVQDGQGRGGHPELT